MEKNKLTNGPSDLTSHEGTEENQGEQRTAPGPSYSEEHSSEITLHQESNGLISRIAPALISFVATLLFYFMVVALFKPQSFLPRLFKPEGATLLAVAVPVLILFFFLWSLADMVQILMNVRKENSILLINSKLFRAIDRLNGHLQKIREEWSGQRKSKTYSRLITLTDMIASARNSQSVYDLFRYQTELDAEKATSKYTLTKIAVWAMPILGFIGTVLGISMAVGNFSGFLTQDIDNIDLVKGELSKVATGLSFAFDTTLFGLVLSLIAMFVSTFIQNFEQKFLTRLEEAGHKIIENSTIEEVLTIQNLQAGAAPEGMLEKFNSLVDEKIMQLTMVSSKILEALSGASDGITREFEKVPVQVADSIGLLTDQLKTASESVATQFGQLPEKISSQVGTLNSQLELTSRSIASEFEKIPAHMEESNKQMKATFERVNERLEEMRNGFSEIALKSEKFYNGDLAPVLNEMRGTLGTLLPVLETLSKPTEIIVTTKK